MKASQTVFNAIGLFLGAMFLLVAFGTRFLIIPDDPSMWWYRMLAWEFATAVLIGAGSLTNLATGKLSAWPTVTSICGYVVSMFFAPLAIWGIIILWVARKANNKTEPAT